MANRITKDQTSAPDKPSQSNNSGLMGAGPGAELGSGETKTPVRPQGASVTPQTMRRSGGPGSGLVGDTRATAPQPTPAGRAAALSETGTPKRATPAVTKVQKSSEQLAAEAKRDAENAAQDADLAELDAYRHQNKNPHPSSSPSDDRVSRGAPHAKPNTSDPSVTSVSLSGPTLSSPGHDGDNATNNPRPVAELSDFDELQTFEPRDRRVVISSGTHPIGQRVAFRIAPPAEQIYAVGTVCRSVNIGGVDFYMIQFLIHDDNGNVFVRTAAAFGWMVQPLDRISDESTKVISVVSASKLPKHNSRVGALQSIFKTSGLEIGVDNTIAAVGLLQTVFPDQADDFKIGDLKTFARVDAERAGGVPSVTRTPPRPLASASASSTSATSTQQ